MLVAILPGCKRTHDAASAAPPPPAPVTIAIPIEREIQNYEEFTGSIAAQYTVEIRSRVTGYLEKIEFEDGTEVAKDAPLFEIDRRHYKALLDKAQGDLVLNEAKLNLAKADNARAKGIAEANAGAISRQDLDKFKSAEAEADAAVQAAKANLEAYRVDLDFTKISSPIAGKTSSRKIDIGNLVLADQTLLTTIVSVDPMYVKFNVDERRLLHIWQEIREGRIRIVENDKLPIELALDNEKGFPHQGMIDFADNQIDQDTGTIQLRGVVANPIPDRGHRMLLPGMFAKVRVPLGSPQRSMLIAEQALGDDQGRKFVFVVDEKSQVQYRRVKTGRVEAGLRVVEEGLNAGEHVIVAGLQRVRPGVTVAATKVEMATFESPAEGASAKDAASTPEKK